MIVEFFKRGRGKSNGPIDYFLGKNLDREHAKLLSGDLEEVAELIDSSPYVKKYTAGCLSFFENDLSDAKKKNIMAAFEKTLFPGLKPDQYRVVWIEHRDKENTEDDNREHLAASGGGRDQKPIESPDRAIDRKTEFSRAISTEFRGINPTNIFSALDKLDQRRELQRAQEQAKKNDRGYDSPSPF